MFVGCQNLTLDGPEEWVFYATGGQLPVAGSSG
jgi:hypothetical protein